MRLIRSLSLTLAAFAAAAGVASAGPGGFTKLFNGKDMSDFTLVGVTPATFKVENGVIICSGQPNGYFATRKSYRNYVLKFDWRYARPANLQNDAAFGGNSGLLIHIAGEHKVWPKCIEVQLMNKDAGNIFGLGAKVNGKKDAAAQAKAIKPVGEWNSEEVICQDGKITAKINGIVVAEGTDADPAEGPIGWQSEGAEIHFRNLEIKEIK
jgi:3-keto-disaccharide hydrolase